MNVFDLKNSDGQLYAFEIEYSLFGRRTACGIAQRIPGCHMLKKPKIMSRLREATFCRFELDRVVFAMEEPFGDNSRYWIGPETVSWAPQIMVVRQAFVDAYGTPSWLRRLVLAMFSIMVAAIACALGFHPHRR